MFTGIIEEIGAVQAIERLADSVVIRLQAATIMADIRAGASISVNGVCLTVVDFDDRSFSVDVMLETLNRSNLGELAVGDKVNLERAMRADGRLDGHIVQGHVDATTTITARHPSEHWVVIRFALPAALAPYVVHKGSIAINGTSLTISELGSDYFEVSLIPTTLAETTFQDLKVGAVVNLEVDVLAKYVERILDLRQ